ncbi:hypothetical protein A3G06_00750 [Candidatus Nomurabacteria bacterium RIFCSPLOWO2_12_FULL_46_14]|uniref:(d)CMP kinase n=1 Tax=Candidatus Nomurabacteria bacterium RIFCSPLOWO2_12_FULL_46_14 TaxID=1801797 RepID=A0A1F6Y8V3_9BACT|nr:MAG: hypothetical protein A3G06_00750 [Candidatus Nomurabacteria bacterium RIFCSPLOWO2_12_FULL_46_14]
MKKEIITIVGVPGSGKSSTADLVAARLDFQRFSPGDFMRKMALETELSLNELGKKAEEDGGEIDRKIDEETRKIGKKEKIVLDSRLGFHWIPESFKVFLDLPLRISAERIFNNLESNKLRAASEGKASKEEVYKKITARLESEKKRFKELYGIADYTDKNHFDLVVDTDKNNLEQVVNIVIAEYKKWLGH